MTDPTNHPDPARELRARFLQTVAAHRKLFLIEGAVLIVAGVAAIVVPPVASLAITIVIGWLFIMGGVVALATTLLARGMPGFWWAFVSAALAVAVGVMLVYSPLRGMLTLTLVLAAYFAIDGVASIMYALEHRRSASNSWAWLLFSGVIDLVLAGLIISGFPGTADWALGVIVGIDMVFGGFALLAVARAAGKQT